MTVHLAGLSPGAVFAGYRIEELVARGGMGVIYRATESRPQRTVALKVVAPELAADAGFRARFLRESQVAASIEHPHVVPVSRLGEVDGVLFIAMRFIGGRDLAALVAAEGRLASLRAATIVDQIADALDTAHELGLVHRDVKPANVLVEHRRRGDHVYLTDFGLTKDLATNGRLTGTGMAVGTTDYMAPEQFEGGPLDARVDVYSLGCVLFEMLSGRVPYERDGQAARMYAHLTARPPAVSELVPGVSSRFDEIIARALAKSPDDRYPSAGDLAAAALAAAERRSVSRAERSVGSGAAAPTGRRSTVHDALLELGSAPTGEPQTAGGDAAPTQITAEPSTGRIGRTAGEGTTGVTPPEQAPGRDTLPREAVRIEPVPVVTGDSLLASTAQTASASGSLADHDTRASELIGEAASRARTTASSQASDQVSSAAVTAETVRRREPVQRAAKPPSPDAATVRRRIAAWGTLIVAIAVIAGIALLLGGGSSNNKPTATPPSGSFASSGPLSLTFASPWRATSGDVAGALLIGQTGADSTVKPVKLVDGVATLAAGPLLSSAAIPGGPPPALVARRGQPASTINTKIGGNQAKEYIWAPTGPRLEAYVLPTETGDLAIICQSSIVGNRAASCDGLVRQAKVSGVQLLLPGPVTSFGTALSKQLQPALLARSAIRRLADPSFSTRAAKAARVAAADTSAAKGLGGISTPGRYRGQLVGLVSALRKEASAFTALAGAAETSNRTAYGSASSEVNHASGLLASAAETLTTAGLHLPRVPNLDLAGPPAMLKPAAPASQLTYTTPTQTAPTQTAPTQTAPTQTAPTPTPPAPRPTRIF